MGILRRKVKWGHNTITGLQHNKTARIIEEFIGISMKYIIYKYSHDFTNSLWWLSLYTDVTIAFFVFHYVIFCPFLNWFFVICAILVFLCPYSPFLSSFVPFVLSLLAGYGGRGTKRDVRPPLNYIIFSAIFSLKYI